MPDSADRLAARLRDYFTTRGDGLAAVYLFGSFGRGEAGPRSDVDVGLLFQNVPASGLASPATRIEDELESLLGLPVQTVVLNTAPADLAHRVLRDGELIHETDRSRRIRFEVAARNEYFDLLPILRRYRRMTGPAV